MNGKPDWSVTAAGAGKMKEPTHSNSPAKSSFQWVFGIFDCSNDANRMSGCLKNNTNPILKMEIIFPKSLARPPRWVRFALPDENWARGGCGRY
jgi:hypothetical protein